MPTGNFTVHLQTFIAYLSEQIPFCIIRPSDGEYMVLQGMNFKNIDNWHFAGNGTLKNELHSSILSARDLSNCFIGIPCTCCNHEIEMWYKNTYSLSSDKITYANLFCNANWSLFTAFLRETQFPFYFIGPESKSNTGLQIKDHFQIPLYLVNTYDIDGYPIFQDICEWVKSRDGPFFFSCGPISKIWAVELYKKYPNKTFIDIGSSIDLFIKGSTNRQYCYPNQHFAQRACYFS